MRSALILFFLTLGTLTNAQSYLITVEGDTLVGKFRILKDDVQGEFIRFKSKKEKAAFDPMEIKQAVTKKNEIYSPIKIEGKYKFCMLEVAGYVNLYSFRSREGAETYTKEILVKADGSSMIVPGAIRQRIILSEFLFECRTVSNNILDKEAYKRVDIKKIVEDFNVCMNSKENLADTAYNSGLSSKENQEKRINDFRTILSYSSEIENKQVVLNQFNEIIERLNSKNQITEKERKAFIASLGEDQDLISLFEKIISY